ncbi:hypothetical protein BD289DRAFT_427049 [Coniella lustricola]|uniref:Uncharacterized protein n=1 Tax=Coniella lustricola TaxID=2025994 RepID=A0A2T3AFM2_9PEZI|nr:hypothetical protein BD289DRAFT_427049 [Coniella lustricola]
MQYYLGTYFYSPLEGRTPRIFKLLKKMFLSSLLGRRCLCLSVCFSMLPELSAAHMYILLIYLQRHKHNLICLWCKEATFYFWVMMAECIV